MNFPLKNCFTGNNNCAKIHQLYGEYIWRLNMNEFY